MNFFDIILINPILNVMVAIYQLLIALHISSAVGFSIVLLTIVIRLYRMLILAVNSKLLNDINNRLYFNGLKLHHVWNTDFFGIPLAHAPKDIWHQIGIWIFLVAVLTAVLQLVQSKMMMPPADE